MYSSKGTATCGGKKTEKRKQAPRVPSHQSRKHGEFKRNLGALI